MLKKLTNPLLIREQGSFAIGGKVISTPGTYNPLQPTAEGQSLHGDHAYVFYQIPDDAHKLPLVFWHGAGQFSKTWETTPDGREGFQTIFLRKGYSVYLINQPRRGNAGRSTVATTLSPITDDQEWFDLFRLGIWPDFFPGVQFSTEPQALNQFFRQMTPDTGPFDLEVISDAVSELFNKIGPAILLTHSQGGGPGWITAAKNPNVRAIIAFEPGSNFVFPREELPYPLYYSGGRLDALPISAPMFDRLTKIPVLLVYGDNIPETPTLNRGQDFWRVRLEMAKRWTETLNRHGGDVSLVHLPSTGIYGNTHFPFSDLNNISIAEINDRFIKGKGLI